MKKILILGLIVCSLLVVPMGSVVGADQDISVEDTTGDVEDAEGNIVERKNIDIAELICIKTGKRVELQLKLVEGGKIDNSINFGYEITLSTSDNQYIASLMPLADEELTVSDQDGNILPDVEYSGVGTRTLSVSFNLSSTDEECSTLSAFTLEYSDEGEIFFDTAPGEGFLSVDAGGPYEGKVGESIDFTGSIEDGGSPPYTWEWDFGDGDTSYEQNPTHTYDEAGTYEVTLAVIDSTGFGFGFDYVNVTISSNGNNNGNGQSGALDSGLILFVALIAIIFVVGIVIVVFIIRR